MWQLAGRDAAGFGLVSDYLGYLADRNYSLWTVRAYRFNLVALCRWLVEQDLGLDMVTTVVLLNFLRACHDAKVPGRPSRNVVSMSGQPLDRYAAATINHRLAANQRVVRVPDDAGPRSAESGAEGAGGAVGGRGRTDRVVGASGAPETAVGAAVTRTAAATGRRRSRRSGQRKLTC